MVSLSCGCYYIHLNQDTEIFMSSLLYSVKFIMVMADCLELLTIASPPLQGFLEPFHPVFFYKAFTAESEKNTRLLLFKDLILKKVLNSFFLLLFIFIRNLYRVVIILQSSFRMLYLGEPGQRKGFTALLV